MNPDKGNRPTIAVAMSGGVDSSVAAAILVKQGYNVIGMMLRLWSEQSQGRVLHYNRCCSPEQMADARRVADRLQIPFYAIDARDYFRREVVDFFVEEHDYGRTPNPCVECNRKVRFNFLLKHALALGADLLATGHYARVERRDGRYFLLRAIDAAKDQSYVLYVLNQEQLAHVLFPIGNLTKQEVRRLASEHSLPVAGKSESMDLCFVRDGDVRRFLKSERADYAGKGPITTTDGSIIGEHDGLAFYTIGQRKGLNIAAGYPLYVIGKDVGRNTLLVGTREELGTTTFHVRDVNWINGSRVTLPIQADVKIRYKASEVKATIGPGSGGNVVVNTIDNLFGVTAGQAAVFYKDDICLGGGIIDDRVGGK